LVFIYTSMSWIKKNDTQTEKNTGYILTPEIKKQEQERSKVPIHPYQKLYKTGEYEKPSWEISESQKESKNNDLEEKTKNWTPVENNAMMDIALKVKIVNDSRLPRSDLIEDSIVL